MNGEVSEREEKYLTIGLLTYTQGHEREEEKKMRRELNNNVEYAQANTA
jgi:hypothetical protein